MKKYVVRLTDGYTRINADVERIWWRERQMRICHDCGVRIEFHGNPRTMWVSADQEGLLAMGAHKEIEDFVTTVEQDTEDKSETK